MSDDTDQTPVYQPPGVPVADHKQASPLTKMVNRLLKPKMKLRMPRGKGLQSDQSVHVKHGKKVRYY
jgi:hypothetical protein